MPPELEPMENGPDRVVPAPNENPPSEPAPDRVAEGARDKCTCDTVRGELVELDPACQVHRDEAAALARASAPSEGRVGGWEVRSEGMHGEGPYAVERGTGPDLEVFVTGIESYDDACKIEAALEPTPPTLKGEDE